MFVVASKDSDDFIILGGVLIYCSNTLLLQRPSLLISHAGRPAAAAVVAAPILKLWLAYICELIPAWSRSHLMAVVRCSLVRGENWPALNSGSF